MYILNDLIIKKYDILIVSRVGYETKYYLY